MVVHCVAVELCSLVCRGLRVRRIAQGTGFESPRDQIFVRLRDRGVTCGTRSIANLSHRHKATRESPRASRSRRVASCARCDGVNVTVQANRVEGHESGRPHEFLVLVEGVQVDRYGVDCYASANRVLAGAVLREMAGLMTIEALAFSQQLLSLVLIHPTEPFVLFSIL